MCDVVARTSRGQVVLIVAASVLEWALLVGSCIGAAYWFSDKPCCGNPAVAWRTQLARIPAPEAYSSYTGLGVTTEQARQRPIAVMISGDDVTRPQSGLGLADVVVEMEAAPGITRMLALFQSVLPREIGSIRSVRNDYIDLAEGFDAPIVHWGGERLALDRLAANPQVDDIDQFVNGDLFFRKPGIPGPHDGFTTGDLMLEALQRYEYERAPAFSAWIFKEDAPRGKRPTAGTLTIPYGNTLFDVEYEYDAERNGYLRSQGGAPHDEALNARQIAPKNVLVVEVPHFVYETHGAYQVFDFSAGGDCTLYQDGREVPCQWKKGDETAPLVATDVDGHVLPIVVGQTWIEVVQPGTGVLWQVPTLKTPSTPE